MSRPTDFQVALALIVIKRKPNDVFVNDYLRDLRVHLQPGRQSQTHYRHLDQAAHWQSQYTTTRELLDRQQDISFSLQQQVDSLKLQLDTVQNRDGRGISKGLTKRRAVDGNQSNSKRPRLVESARSVIPASFSTDFEALDVDYPGRKALRNLLELHTLLKGKMYDVDARRLAAHITNTAVALSAIIIGISVHHESTRTARLSAERHVATITAISRAYSTLLHALKKLSSYNESDRLTGHAIFHCAHVIDDMFTTIEEVSTNEAKAQLALGISMKPPSKAQRLANTIGPIASTQTLLSYLTNSVLATLSHLDTKSKCHAQLLEAILYHLINRLGEIEHLFAFDIHRSNDIEDEIRTLSPPSNETRLDPAHILERRAMIVEAPYMIAMLKKALAVVPQTLKRDLARGLRDEKFYLYPHALDRLQRTLVDCIFGPDGRGSSLASRDVLEMPRLNGHVETVAEIEREKHKSRNDGKDEVQAAEKWFENQLWSLLGWDILGREEDL